MHVASAGARGRGLFATNSCASGTVLPLGEPLAATEAPGSDGAACARCGRLLAADAIDLAEDTLGTCKFGKFGDIWGTYGGTSKAIKLNSNF